MLPTKMRSADAGKSVVRTLARWSVLCIACICYAGCTTTDNIQTIFQVLPYQDGELTIQATVLNLVDLNTRYRQGNPFIAPHRLIAPFDFFVVELAVDMPENFGIINRNDIVLEFSSYRDSSRSTRAMLAFWEKEIEVHGN